MFQTTKEMTQIIIQKIEKIIEIQEEMIKFNLKERKYLENKYKELKWTKSDK